MMTESEFVCDSNSFFYSSDLELWECFERQNLTGKLPKTHIQILGTFGVLFFGYFYLSCNIIFTFFVYLLISHIVNHMSVMWFTFQYQH